MAALVTLGGAGSLFVGEDKTLKWELIDTTGVPVDMSGWAIRLLVLSSSGTVMINKTASITGSYSSTRSANTQRAVVTLTDTDMEIPDGTHQHSLKRTDDGSETILTYGPCIVERATQV